MFTKNVDVKHHIKVYFLFKNSKLPSIPEEVEKDFKEEESKIISFYQDKKVIVLVSLGEKDDLDIDSLQKIVKNVRTHLKNYPKKIPLFFLENHMLEDQIQLIEQSYYKFDYKTKKTSRKSKKTSNKKTQKKSPKFYIHLKNKKLNPQHQTILASSIQLLQNLGDEPANILTPPEFVKRIQKVCQESNLKCKVMDSKKLKKMGMNSLLSVSNGSNFDGYLVEISHLPTKEKPIVMVGKGITFDAGGISLKRPNKMYEMKADMLGSGILLATMRNVGMMKMKKNVVALLAIAENAIGKEATRPGDVVKSYSGKTIEIRNTDAEGRLVMADALTYGHKFNPKLILDISTLTGQQWSMSCGLFGSIMGYNEKTVRKFINIGKKTNDRLVEMPLYKEFIKNTESKIADVKNAEFKCDRASTINAGAFLSNFVDDKLDWIHLDVAGPTFMGEKTKGYGVRLLTEVVRDL